MMLTLPRLWQGLGETPASEFLVGPEWTLLRSDLSMLVRRFSTAFDRRGVAEDDRVLIVCRDEQVSVAAFIACLMDGVVPVMLAPDSPAERCRDIVRTVGARLALVDAARAAEDWVGAALVLSNDRPTRSLWKRRPSRGEQLAAALALPEAGREPRLPTEPEALAYLLFTSGTTASPTGVMILRRNLMANLETLARMLEVGADARIFNDMMLAHADGLIQGPLLALATGATALRGGGFALRRLEDWLNRVRQARATHFLTVPTVWAMIDRYSAHDDYFDAPEFRHLSSVAAALPEELWRRIEARFGRPLTNQYGLTETVASAVFAGPAVREGMIGSIGLPVDCEARLVPDGEGAGELQLRGDNVFPGYWQNPERTAEAFTEDGWMRTGDLAERRADGCYQIVGRLKTVIMTGGFLIRPEEIDATLRQHSGVAEATTVGLPDADFGEIAVTAVVIDPAIGPDEAGLTAYLRTRLEPLKVPKRIVVLDAIPRGLSGKPKLDALRDLLRSAVGPARRPDHAPTDIAEGVFETAASVFRVPVVGLSLRSMAEDVEGWDSFAHVALILALEERFGCRIPSARAAAIRSLGEAVRVLQDLVK